MAKIFSENFVIPDYKNKVDLNIATLAEMKAKLPISEKQINDIYDYREFIAFFKTIYDLRKIPSIDQKTLLKLKPYVIISHHELEDPAAKRREDIHFLIERLGSNEGSQEGTSDIWEDYLMTPRNVNNMYFSELLNIPNVSAIDAAAIMNVRKQGDLISSYRTLRKIPGISHYGAVNLKNYIFYKPRKQQNRVYVDYQLKYNDTPYESTVKDMFTENMLRNNAMTTTQSYWGFFNMDKTTPAVLNKLRLRYNNQWKAGALYYSNKGEKDLLNDNFKNILSNGKYYLGYNNSFSFAKIKTVLGNYRATFGEGLVMENTDFYSPRKTGYGFSKRIVGIIGDLSRTQEYSLKGGAAQINSKHFGVSAFISSDDKDAMVFDSNKNGRIDDDDDVFSYVTLSRRFTNSQLETAENYLFANGVRIAPRLDYLNEKLAGFHLEYSPLVGSHIGFTGYNAVYDKDFTVYQPKTDDIETDLRYLLIENASDNPQKKFKLIDSEISSMYSTKSYKYGYDRNYRRVLGIDWQTTFSNTSLQGEYAELSVNGSTFNMGDDPSALIISSYSQFDNLYVLAMYRDYDLEFDNPYSRAFSESQRFDDTILEKLTYGLNNTLLTDMYNNSAQASAEQGFYLETRYQFNRYFTISKAYLDIWKRKADGRRNVRFEGTLQFRPIHALRFDLRYKQQIKRYDETLDRGRSKVDETTLKLRSYLSAFDLLQLEYRYSRTISPPYTSLTNSAEIGGADMAQANTLFNGDYIAADYTHHFNDNLKVKGAIMFWKGNHWDFEDVNLDFVDDEGLKYWFTFSSKVANNLYLSLKYKHVRYIPHYKEFRVYNELPDPPQEYYYPRVETFYNSLRLQIDWKL